MSLEKLFSKGCIILESVDVKQNQRPCIYRVRKHISICYDPFIFQKLCTLFNEKIFQKITFTFPCILFTLVFFFKRTRPPEQDFLNFSYKVIHDELEPHPQTHITVQHHFISVAMHIILNQQHQIPQCSTTYLPSSNTYHNAAHTNLETQNKYHRTAQNAS